MPKGQKLIDWTSENDARLMLTILAVENVHPNCEAVAAAFGGAVNAMAISNRLSRLRKKAADEGFMPRGDAATSTKGRKSTAAGKDSKAGKKGGTVADDSEAESSGVAREGSENPPTLKKLPKNQKVLTGRVTKPRLPAKQSTKRSVKTSEDVAAKLENTKGYSAEESGYNNEAGSEEDAVEQIKVEEDGA